MTDEILVSGYMFRRYIKKTLLSTWSDIVMYKAQQLKSIREIWLKVKEHDNFF